MPKLPNTPKRRPIRADELFEIFKRQQERRYGYFPPDAKRPVMAYMFDWLRKFGTCECNAECGERFSLEPGHPSSLELDHYNPNAAAEDGDEIVWRALRRKCHSKKTNGLRGDKSTIAKIKRLNGTTADQQERRDRKDAKGIRRWDKGRKIQSRGFHKRLRKKMNGTVEVRDARS